jgi:hypothetical protein
MSVRTCELRAKKLQYAILSDHPKPANSYHLKTGQRE